MENPFSCVKTKQQIANEYGVCWKTFDKWLKRKGIKIERGLIPPIDQKMIYEKLGFPENPKKSK